MRSEDVVELYRVLHQSGIAIWIDGGWAVDAVVGRQTRSHYDLDIAIEAKALSRCDCSWRIAAIVKRLHETHPDGALFLKTRVDAKLTFTWSSSTSATTSTSAMQGKTLPSTSRHAAPISFALARYSRLSVT